MNIHKRLFLLGVLSFATTGLIAGHLAAEPQQSPLDRLPIDQLPLDKLPIEPVIEQSDEAHGKSGKMEKPHWGYADGEGGPENWGMLNEDFAACSVGQEQSPINLTGAVDSELAQLSLAYQPTPLKILNNGHTVQVNYEPGSVLTLDSEAFELLQFHFHTPSEHTVAGEAIAMEVHLVHQNPETKALAVVGVFMKEGLENPEIAAIWPSMPTSKADEKTIDDQMVNVAKLLPSDTDSFYRYYGSLTTPPCSEVVNWIVMKEPIEVSRSQIKQFAAAVGEMNARPVQPLNRRFLLD